ncbi:hypothetical protein AGMMS49982_02500 [Bacteroidia bacterium]|nr:hypothetical protein AGMMS49982_02500 [Bacteroidia bacterium]
MKIRFITRTATQWGETVYLSGSAPELGEWHIKRAIPLSNSEYPQWESEIDIADIWQIVEYKYFIKDAEGNVRWEDGNNRLLKVKEVGVAIPIFSLRTKNSFGIGDFGDLKQLIDWAKLTGMTVIQTLPITDTTRTHTRADSYPYNAISIYALHPLYPNLDAMGKLNSTVRRSIYKVQQEKLNALPTLDYEQVDYWKWIFFRELFAQEGSKVLASKSFTQFYNNNRDWLVPYATFSYERDRGYYAGKEKVTPKKLKLYYYLQYHADKQMREAKAYAHANGVLLKGDIPIGVSRDSVEVQTEPQLFNLNFQAGAPPDSFTAEGQNWGFPTYNWEAMAANNFRWWKNRFRKMADYFDAYRIDHILGFFRIWQIPITNYRLPVTGDQIAVGSGKDGYFCPALPYSRIAIEGYPLELFIEDVDHPGFYHPRITATELGDLHWDYFYKRHNMFWKYEALKRLRPLVGSTKMLACGEDLGMIPACVPEVMDELRILSLEIERMPKSPGSEFTNLNALPYLSVCTTSTHDMTTLRGWWQEDREKTQHYYNNVLNQRGIAPNELTPKLAEIILHNHLQAPSRMTIIPLQDWLAIDKKLQNPDIEAERINIPADPNHYWQYRMHLPIEDLLAADALNKKIRQQLMSLRA